MSPACPRQHRGWDTPVQLDRIPAEHGGGWDCPGIAPDGTDCGYRLPPGGPPAPGHRTLNVILRDAIRAATSGDPGRLPGLRAEYDAAAAALFTTLTGNAGPAVAAGLLADLRLLLEAADTDYLSTEDLPALEDAISRLWAAVGGER